MKLRLTIEYDGTGFHGWARQPGQRTVEGVLREALDAVFPRWEGLAVAGRTDAGVHATGQVASLDAAGGPPATRAAEALNGELPDDAAVLAAEQVPESFHARFSANGRRYVYLLPDDGSVDADRLQRYLVPLVGRRDFTAFARDTRKGQTTVRTLFSAVVRPFEIDRGRFLSIHLEADGFLRRQVRVMIGTALRELTANAPEDSLVRIAETKDRWQTGAPVSAEGLYLSKVCYPVSAG